MGNYVAAVGGDYFGINHDNHLDIPATVATVVDLLDDAGISWGEYQEDMPYTGFTGDSWVNPETQANMYVRKHNPLVIFDSVRLRPERLQLLKNTTVFDSDLQGEQLPQWVCLPWLRLHDR